jgi:hypothetical protein
VAVEVVGSVAVVVPLVEVALAVVEELVGVEVVLGP